MKTISADKYDPMTLKPITLKPIMLAKQYRGIHWDSNLGLITSKSNYLGLITSKSNYLGFTPYSEVYQNNTLLEYSDSCISSVTCSENKKVYAATDHHLLSQPNNGLLYSFENYIYDIHCYGDDIYVADGHILKKYTPDNNVVTLFQTKTAIFGIPSY